MSQTTTLAPPTSGAQRCVDQPHSRLVRIGLLGCGTVGRAVVGLIEQADAVEAIGRCGAALALTGVLVRDAARPRDELPAGVDLFDDADEFFAASEYDIVVEALGGVEPARTLVDRALRRGIPVVTCNKTLIARHGDELSETARRFGTTLRHEAAVIAGLPFLGQFRNRPLASRVQRITGILNGTSHYVLTAMDDRQIPLGTALREARAAGYAEPDAESDLSGIDAAEKLVIVLRQLGIDGLAVDDVERADVRRVKLQSLERARDLGGTLKPVVDATVGGESISAYAGPAFVAARHRLASVRGAEAENAIRLQGDAIGDLFFAGPGAGPDVTAATILDDVIETFAAGPTPDAKPVPATPGKPARVIGFRLKTPSPFRERAGVRVDLAESRGSFPSPNPLPKRERALQTEPGTDASWFVELTHADDPPPAESIVRHLSKHDVLIRRSNPCRRGPGGSTFCAIVDAGSAESLERALAHCRGDTGCTVWTCPALED